MHIRYGLLVLDTAWLLPAHQHHQWTLNKGNSQMTFQEEGSAEYKTEPYPPNTPTRIMGPDSELP